MVPPGSYSFGPHNGRVVVKTCRDGSARKVGHDLVIEVVQSRWGIKPFSAMMGALRVKDQADIRFEVDAPA